MAIKSFFLWLLPGIFFLFTSFSPFVPEHFTIQTIVLDAGHGGKDPGTHGKRAIEKDVALAVVLKLGKMLKEKYPGLKVIYTRQTDVFIELHERAAIANRNKADLFISVHCNSGPSHACGSETYAMGLHTSEGNLGVAKRENAVVLKEDNYLKKYGGFDPSSPMAHIFFANVQNVHLENSLSLAQKIENQFISIDGKKSRGVKQAGFLVLWKTTMPSVLIELGYLTHIREEKAMETSEGQDKLAKSILKAISRFKQEAEKKS
jgi:N-acetylmuramoyl-L-alanine amidase